MTATRARLSDVAAGMAPLVLLVALWFVLATFGFAPAALLPAPQTVLLRFAALLVDPQFLSHCGVTLYRLFTGFALAAVIGIGIGIAAAGSRAIRAAVTPLVRVLAPLPKIALYPAFVLTLGFEHSSKIALVVCDAVFPILLATRRHGGRAEAGLVGARGRRVARALPVLGRAAGGASVRPDRLPHLAGHCVHRGVPGRDDHLDRRPRAYAGARGAQLPDRRHVRPDHRHLAARAAPQRRIQSAARAAVDRLSGGRLNAGRPDRGQVDRRVLRGSHKLRRQARRHRRDPVGDAVARAQRPARGAGIVAPWGAAVSRGGADT